MIPVAPLVSVVVVLARIWAWRRKNPGTPFRSSTVGVRRSEPHQLNLAARLFVCFPATALLLALQPHHPYLSDLGFFLLVVVSLPALVLRVVLVPLGLPRAAYWFAFLSPPRAHSVEIRGGAVLMGALALGRSSQPSPATAAWLEEKLGHQSNVRSLSIAAAGLLAAARGNEGGARAILRAVEGVTLPSWAPLAISEARTWLVLDAARRGDWGDVAAIGADGTAAPTFRWPYLMGILARRLTLDPIAPTNGELWKAWLRAPYRLATLPLLRRALATIPLPETASPASPASEPLPSDPADLLATALEAHAACLQRPSPASLVVTARAWDAVRTSPAVASLLARRALALEAHTGADAVLTRLLASVETDLVRPFAEVLAPAARAPLIRTSATLKDVAARVDRRAMEDIEALAKAYADRTKERRELEPPIEWLEWGRLRGACDAVVRDAPSATKRAVFEAVYSPTCNFAVWLYNLRDEKLLANAMFRWLRDRAREADHAGAVAVLEKNVLLGVGR